MHCNQCSDGVVLDRIGRLFDVIVVDEAQVMAGYDFDFISGLIKSGVESSSAAMRGKRRI